MFVHHYQTSGGKDLILNYIDSLPICERADGLNVIDKLERDGLEALKILSTRHLKDKLWEIRFGNNRIMYVVANENNIYLLHACKKQKNKTEDCDLNTALDRMKKIRIA